VTISGTRANGFARHIEQRRATVVPIATGSDWPEKVPDGVPSPAAHHSDRLAVDGSPTPRATVVAVGRRSARRSVEGNMHAQPDGSEGEGTADRAIQRHPATFDSQSGLDV
jgi:hypothetical protein